MKILTVFTPAYNRAHTLPRTYESLLKQNNKDFIWLIIDDGSSDNTEELVREWQSKDNGFEIRYIYKENGGMHTAHNTAYANIDTELNICIDSDDCMAENAVDKILSKWAQVRDKGYAGIIALDADMNTGNIIGKGFPEGMTETTLSSYYAQGGAGDKKLIYRTDVINQYPPYPVFEGEKYVSLSCIYVLIDQQYKLGILNEILCEVEYQPDGSTHTMWNQYIKNPKGFAYLRKTCMEYAPTKRKMFTDCVHYVSSSIFSRNIHFLKESPKKLMTVLAIPAGVALNLLVRYKVKTLD